MKQKQQIITIEDKVKPLLTKAVDLVIKGEQDLTTATELLSQANITLKEVKTAHKEEAEPFETPLKVIDMRYAPTEKALKGLIDDIRLKVGSYQTEATKLLKEKEEAIARRIGEGRGKLQVGTAVNKLSELERPVEKVVSSSGSLSFRSYTVLKVTNVDLIPRAYFDLNEASVLKTLKQGGVVPGAEIEIVQTPVNYR